MPEACRLPRAFYARPTLRVARELLGKTLVHNQRSGTIVEVEAYIGPDDRASHARVGRKGRAAIMYGPAGFAYVYLIYGVHFCFNVVTETDGFAGAVLIRAIEADNRTGSGPGLVCRALGIDRSCNGVDLTTSELYVADAKVIDDEHVRVGPRIGVDYAGEWSGKPWRMWVATSKHVSGRKQTGTTFDPTMLG